MTTDQNPKQLVAQRLKDATNILVTVSRNPGVDDLSAALALTLILDKLGKTPTAVFSGTIPPAIEFLEPGKTFDSNVDGLRDFIIALDKEKADRLRYKVEDDVVRVFITPYKTTISEKDLTFSQGDFNVDLVVAFGVEKREDLDAAITAHGRILHDAAVVTINQLPGGSTIGEIDWTDSDASSLSEMLMSLTESLQSGLLDQPIATALLTGLVSATDRFRNEKTSPKVMTMAAQLMAAGANQQLIAEKLEEASSVSTGKLNVSAKPSNDEPPKKSNAGEMKVEHGGSLGASDTNSSDAAGQKAVEVASKESADAVEEAQEELREIVDTKLPPVDQPDRNQRPQARASSWRDAPTPSVGGTLNATTDEAEEENRKEEQDTQNRVILSHDSPALGEQSSQAPIINAATLPSNEPTIGDIFSVPSDAQQVQPAANGPVVASSEPVLEFEETALPPAPSTRSNPTLADLEAQVRQQEVVEAPTQGSGDPLANARAAVDAALGAQPFNPAGQPLASTGAQPLGSIERSESTESTPTALASEQTSAALPPPPPLPPLPDFSTLPPLPGEVVEPTVTPATPTAPSFGLPEEPATNEQFPMGTPVSNDPAQFKLPGQ